MNPVKYLGVFLDSRWSFYNHIVYCNQKSSEMYSRLRTMISVNWGVRADTARALYKSVFLPSITYPSFIWLKATLMAKSVKLLGSCQKQPLLATTVVYRTVSTDAQQVIADALPLDLVKRT